MGILSVSSLVSLCSGSVGRRCLPRRGRLSLSVCAVAVLVDAFFGRWGLSFAVLCLENIEVIQIHESIVPR